MATAAVKAAQKAPSHWLDRYATSYHAWRPLLSEADGSSATLFRPQGLIERGFDLDAIHNEGRADINASLELDCISYLSPAQLRRRIRLAWTALTLHHALLLARADSIDDERCFLVQPPAAPTDALAASDAHIAFVEDAHPNVDFVDFYRHSMNVARVVDPTKALSKLFVFPLEPRTGSGAKRTRLRFLLVMAHQISDGLTNHTWLSHLVDLLNTPIAKLERDIAASCQRATFIARLPLPQEDLYPPVAGNKARQRWSWAITRVLRHVHSPQPPAFQNPLRFSTPASEARSPPQSYPRLLDYGKVPPLNSYTVQAHISKEASSKLIRLCKEAKTSVGAGCFVLVAMVMMSMQESRFPDEPLASRHPFIGSFPINPRPFFNHHSAPNSMMLTFSDGVVLPFLPSNLDFAKRFRLLVKRASKQLSQYQKGARASAAASAGLAGRIVPAGYIAAIERTWTKLPMHLRGEAESQKLNPQGKLAVKPSPNMATCGVSSVGRSLWDVSKYGVDSASEAGIGARDVPEDRFLADFRDSWANVRARDGEFLVGIWGGHDGTIAANVSFDGNAIDEELAAEWKRRLETALDGLDERARL